MDYPGASDPTDTRSGSPAFPSDTTITESLGMSLRDWFAGADWRPDIGRPDEG